MEINSSRLISLSEQAGIGIDSQLHTRLLYPATRKIDGEFLSGRIRSSQKSAKIKIIVRERRKFNFSLVEKMILKLAFLFSFFLSFFSRERDSIRIACTNILLESGFLMLRDLAS